VAMLLKMSAREGTGYSHDAGDSEIARPLLRSRCETDMRYRRACGVGRTRRRRRHCHHCIAPRVAFSVSVGVWRPHFATATRAIECQHICLRTPSPHLDDPSAYSLQDDRSRRHLWSHAHSYPSLDGVSVSEQLAVQVYADIFEGCTE
jgi:hypothetical protein